MELERQIEDQPIQPTSPLGPHSFGDQRKILGRKEDREKVEGLEHLGPRLLFLLILIVGLNILDSLFTMMILDRGGWELNPIVWSAINYFGDRFWVWKFCHVSVNLMFLCLYSRFPYVQKAILGICVIYLLIIIYQVALLKFYLL